MKSLAIYYIRECDECIEDYVIYSLNELKNNADSIVIICSKAGHSVLKEKLKVTEKEWINSVDENIIEKLCIITKNFKIDRVLFSDSSYYGPFISWYSILKKMEKNRGWKAWSLSENKEVIYESALWCLKAELIEKVNFNKAEGFSISLGEDVDCINYINILNDYDGSYDFRKFRCLELLEKGVPVLYKVAFDRDNFDISMGSQLRKAIDYIERKTDYNTSLIYNDLLKHKNLTQLYERLHWNYILPINCTVNENAKSSAAVVVCLYYKKTLIKNLDYIRKLPSYIDIYIIAKRQELCALIDEYCVNFGLSCNVKVSKENRGRDLSALLVEAVGIFDKYEFICFIHDKQTTGGVEADIVGDDFNEILFENLIGNTNYVKRIIQLFKENDCLGILAPPEICHSTYFSILGKEWTNNFENVKRLADKLGLSVKIEREYAPYILSTAFWCRTKALRKLMKFGWKYEDFPDEPLNMDGTINHALERIIMYVAQDAGYYSGIVQTNEFAGLYMMNLKVMLDDSLSVCHQKVLFSKHSEIFEDHGNKMLKFCKGATYLLIYGTGGNSCRVVDFLTSNKIEFFGYLVSDGYKENDYFCGKNVYELSDIVKMIRNLDSVKILISVNKKLQKEIIPLLEKKNIFNFYCI